MHMALCDVIKVKGSKSIQIVRSQSCNGVLTMAAFASGHLRSTI
jgi:hypothetical protein